VFGKQGFQAPLDLLQGEQSFEVLVDPCKGECGGVACHGVTVKHCNLK
jgi:hypothetical protein